MHGGSAVFVFPYVEDIIWIVGMGVVYVINTIVFLFASIKNPGYIKKDKSKTLIDLLQMTQDTNKICPFCEVNY